MSEKFKVGDWVLIPLDRDVYKITKIYEDEGKTLVDLDDGDNFKLIGKSIDMIREIPKRNK
tara:strand:- start:12 stop:194 length:183 start_codon:yes stop_codon:yes gene_type:complete